MTCSCSCPSSLSCLVSANSGWCAEPRFGYCPHSIVWIRSTSTSSTWLRVDMSTRPTRFGRLALLMALSASIALAASRSEASPRGSSAFADTLAEDTSFEHRNLAARYESVGLLPSRAFNCTSCYSCLATASAAAPSKTICRRECRACYDKQEIMALSEITFSTFSASTGRNAVSIKPSGVSFQGPLGSSGPLTSNGRCNI